MVKWQSLEGSMYGLQGGLFSIPHLRVAEQVRLEEELCGQVGRSHGRCKRNVGAIIFVALITPGPGEQKREHC
jgi:hypothetical protein